LEGTQFAAFIFADLALAKSAKASLRTQRAESQSHHAVIRVYDEADNVIETHKHTGEFKELYDSFFSSQATILGFLDDPVEAARRFWIL